MPETPSPVDLPEINERSQGHSALPGRSWQGCRGKTSAADDPRLYTADTPWWLLLAIRVRLAYAAHKVPNLAS